MSNDESRSTLARVISAAACGAPSPDSIIGPCRNKNILFIFNKASSSYKIKFKL